MYGTLEDLEVARKFDAQEEKIRTLTGRVETIEHTLFSFSHLPDQTEENEVARTDKIPAEKMERIKAVALELDQLIEQTLTEDPDPLIQPNYLVQIDDLIHKECSWVSLGG